MDGLNIAQAEEWAQATRSALTAAAGTYADEEVACLVEYLHERARRATDGDVADDLSLLARTLDRAKE